MITAKTTSETDYWIRGLWTELQRVTEALGCDSDGFNSTMGILLSGGLDSSLVASMTLYTAPDLKLVSYSIDYGDGTESELGMARKVAEYLGMEFRVVKLDADTVIQDLEYLQRIYDEPMVKFTFIPTYYLAKEAAKDIKVLLTGDGGDELFIGYRRDYWEDPVVIRLLSKMGMFRKPILGIGRQLCVPLTNLTGSKMLALATELFTRENATHPEWQYRVASRVCQPYFSDEELVGLLGPKHTPMVNSSIADAIQRAEATNNIDKLSHTMIGTRMADDLLRLEKAALATGLEIRSPLLDASMINFALSIPVEIRYQQGITKYLLRKLINDYGLLPPEITANMSKAGLTAPIQKWLIDARYRDYFGELLESGVRALGIDREYVKRVYPPRTFTQALKAWALVGMSLWVRTMLDDRR